MKKFSSRLVVLAALVCFGLLLTTTSMRAQQEGILLPEEGTVTQWMENSDKDFVLIRVSYKNETRNRELWKFDRVIKGLHLDGWVKKKTSTITNTSDSSDISVSYYEGPAYGKLLYFTLISTPIRTHKIKGDIMLRRGVANEDPDYQWKVATYLREILKKSKE